jgi:hypothetical protein
MQEFCMSSIKSFSDASADRMRQTAFQHGSTLIWVMVVVLVMIIALGIGLAAVSGQFNLSSVRHEEHQAYYTALSSTETIAAWITENTGGNGDPEEAKVIKQLFARIINAGPDGITIDVAGIPAEAGTCTVNLRWLDSGSGNHLDGGGSKTNNQLNGKLNGKQQLKITSTATFAGTTETVSLTLNRDLTGTPSGYGEKLKASDFSTTTHDARASEIQDLTSGGIVPLYESSSANNSTKNASDLAVLNEQIPDASSTKEARWTNVNVNSATADHNAEVLGTQRYPTNSRSDTAVDTRRFAVPINGKIMIDPLENGGDASERTNRDNTKISTLAIDSTAGKDVLFRLASDSAAVGLGATRNRSALYLNSLLMFNFTDNANSTDNLAYTVNGVAKTHTWHPNNWNKLDIYVQQNSKVTSNIILGPFGHKYDNFLDYWSWGNFVDHWHGNDTNEYRTLWPYVSSPSTSGKGLPVFPVDYGKNAGFWILDGNASRYFRILQGANIIDGTIYSTRPAIIGGGLIRSKGRNNQTTDSINNSRRGFAHYSIEYATEYVEATTRYSQLICNTDIILKAPSSGTAQSLIRRPDTWQDRTDTVPAHDKNFNPAMTIKGGTICVGERQSLAIQGAVLDNMWISPDKIVVGGGGALTIESSAFTNVLADIYVDGGTLTISAGAKIKGDIYVYNGGTVKAEGSFQLDAPDALATGHQPGEGGAITGEGGNEDTLAAEHKPGGLLIYGAGTIGATFKDKDGNIVAEITDVGLLEAPAAFAAITGNSGKVHLIGGDWADLVKGTKPFSTAGAILCDDYDPTTGRCPHYNGIPSDHSASHWITGIYSDN